MNDETENNPGTQERHEPDELEDQQAQIGPEQENELTDALSSTLDSLNQSIQLMETIVHKLEAGEADWEESVRMLAEANELAVESSQKLDRVVQDVVYGAEEGDSSDQETIPGL